MLHKLLPKGLLTNLAVSQCPRAFSQLAKNNSFDRETIGILAIAVLIGVGIYSAQQNKQHAQMSAVSIQQQTGNKTRPENETKTGE